MRNCRGAPRAVRAGWGAALRSRVCRRYRGGALRMTGAREPEAARGVRMHAAPQGRQQQAQASARRSNIAEEPKGSGDRRQEVP